MTALTEGTDYFIRRKSTEGVTELLVYTIATVDNGDTLTVDLTNYGINNFLGANGYIHSTTDSIIVAEAPTTAVSSGVLTVTVGGTTANKKRTYTIMGV